MSAEVLAAARRRSDALVGKDIETLLALMHPDCLYISSRGAVLNRDEYIDTYVRADDVRWTSQTLRLPRIASAGEAVVTMAVLHADEKLSVPCGRRASRPRDHFLGAVGQLKTVYVVTLMMREERCCPGW